jgi:hypothetical protein
MLIVEFGDILHRDNKWNIPKHIRPLTREAEEQHSLIYDVVGLVFCDPTPKLAHFIARYSPDGKRVYNYDDLSHGGYAQLMKNATIKSHLVGDLHDIPAPEGFSVHGVVYRLRGGSDVQNFFADYQMAAAERLHHVHVERDLKSPSSIPTISLSHPGISSIDPDNLIWLKNPATTRNIEYEQVATLNTDSNSKRKAPSQRAHKKTKKLRILLPVLETKDQPPEPPGNEEEKASNQVSVPELTENLLDLQASGDEETLSNHVGVPEIEIEKPLDLDDGESEASDYAFHCRCGTHGNGHEVAGGQQTIRCDLCENWSHIACQRGGRASNLHPKAAFYCDGCSTQQSKGVLPTRK